MNQYAIEILKIGAIAATGLFSTTGIVAFFKWFTGRRQKLAEAGKTQAEIDRVPSAGWRAYAEKQEKRLDLQEKRMDAMRAEFEARINALHKDYETRLALKDVQLETQEAKYRAELFTRDEKIEDLTMQVRDLQHQMNSVQTYNKVTNDVRKMETEQAKEDLHIAVDEKMGNITT